MSDPSEQQNPIGLAAVGVSSPQDGLADEVADNPRFEVVAFCDEGIDEGHDRDTAVEYYPDYNAMLKDERVELIAVDMPVSDRQDYAVRALNAGRHTVVRPPFATDADEGERILKTSLKSDLLATCDMKGRDDPDFLALRTALEGANISTVYGLDGFRDFGEVSEPGFSAPDILDEFGFELFDQLNMLHGGEVGSVNTLLYRPREGAPPEHFCVNLSMRNRAWASLQGSIYGQGGLPSWCAFAPGSVFTVSGGSATIHGPTGTDVQEGGTAPESFWDNLYRAVREDEPLKCHPADIVRAMKLHEAAVESAEVEEPVTL
jgi:predicted dehydrogenase